MNSSSDEVLPPAVIRKLRGKSAHLIPVLSHILRVYREHVPDCQLLLKTTYAVIVRGPSLIGVVFFRSGCLEVGFPHFPGANKFSRLSQSQLPYTGIAFQTTVSSDRDVDREFGEWVRRIAKTIPQE